MQLSLLCKNSDDACDVNDTLQKMSTVDNEVNDTSICANCGKEGANNICNKCKMVKYCNAACKKKHRHKHKKDCEEHVRLADDRATKLHDEKLFRQPPPAEDCPICFLRIPSLASGRVYKTCCGKMICCGCCHAPVYDDQGNLVDNEKQNQCPFCRVIAPKSDEENIERLNKRMEANDAYAIQILGHFYNEGLDGLRQDRTKALELWHRAAELGYALAYCNISYSYHYGEGVEVDKKKANHYYELAAMKGDVTARRNLGIMEHNAGNYDRALKHYMIASRGGYSNSLKEVKELHSKGHATKEDYAHALRSYQEYLGEIKSVQRDKAAAARENYSYY